MAQQRHDHYLVEWQITVDASEAPDAREAARKVWVEVFDRSEQPGPDEACIFRVVDPDGAEHRIDLSEVE